MDEWLRAIFGVLCGDLVMGKYGGLGEEWTWLDLDG